MKIGVSGSRGFIGGHLTRTLESLGYKVFRVDRGGKCKVKELDYFVDLAAYGNYHFQNEPEAIFKVNILRLIKIIKNIKIKKGIVLTSSASVELPVYTYYGVSKKAVEELGRLFNNTVPTVTLRPSTIIGRGEASHHLIPTIIRSCFTYEKMFFTPKPSHDFLSVHDYVDAVMHTIRNIKKLRGEIYSVGTGVSRNNKEILDLVESITGYKANIEIKESLRPQDVKKWVVKNTLRGWKPKNKIEEVIQTMTFDYLPFP